MATYKVLQDIEAEDKILGPLTLRQFIYALITCFFLYLCFIVIAKHAAFLLVFFLPPALFTGFFTFPFGKDQPTEVWAVARIGFLFKPRKRIWDQSGIKELVTVTVPKKIERIYTNGLSPTEVESRLSALATTIDSRGWAIKNVNVNLYASAAMTADVDRSDRLVAMSSMPQPVLDYDIKASDDMLDVQSNPIAQQFTEMITASSKAHRQQLIDTMNSPSATPVVTAVEVTQAPAGMWFTGQSPAVGSVTTVTTPFVPHVLEPTTAVTPVAPDPAAPTAEEIAVLNHLKAEASAPQTYNARMKTIQPLSAALPPVQAQLIPPTLTAPILTVDPVIENLSRSNDLNISTLAREAHKAKLHEGLDETEEVIISLR